MGGLRGWFRSSFSARFVRAFAAMGLVVGFISAVKELVSTSWALVAVVLVVLAGAWAGGGSAVDALRRVRDYPRLLTLVAEYREKNSALESALSEWPRSASSMVESATREGALSSLAAAHVAADMEAGREWAPTVMGVTVDDGEVLIHACIDPPRDIVAPYMRWILCKAGVRRVVGAVSVVEVAEDGSGVVLKCCRSFDDRFWDRVEQEAILRDDVLAGCTLEAYVPVWEWDLTSGKEGVPSEW